MHTQPIASSGVMMEVQFGKVHVVISVGEVAGVDANALCP